jgi:hypothetical protein
MTVGITGHQRLPDPNLWEWVKFALEAEIAKIPKPLVGVTCLASGADQLFARIVLSYVGRLIHVKPFADYERTFDASGLAEYRKLMADAEIEALCVKGDDEDAYMAAGKRVVDRSDQMYAVWDGQSARGKGGTADIVGYAQSRALKVIHLNPSDRAIHVLTPR